MSDSRIAERATHAHASDSPVHRYLLPRVGASDWDARTVRPMRDRSRVPSTRLTTRGRVVVVLAWIVTAWILASVLPYWWLRF